MLSVCVRAAVPLATAPPWATAARVTGTTNVMNSDVHAEDVDRVPLYFWSADDGMIS
jgi:hypothetical protein